MRGGRFHRRPFLSRSCTLWTILACFASDGRKDRKTPETLDAATHRRDGFPKSIGGLNEATAEEEARAEEFNARDDAQRGSLGNLSERM
jgi:hypothetical protein